MTFLSKTNNSFIHQTFGKQPIWTLAEILIIPHWNAFKSRWIYFINLAIRLIVIAFYIVSFFASVHYDGLILSKNVPLILKIGNNLNMYLNVCFVISGWLMTRKFNQLDKIFDSIFHIDQTIMKISGNDVILNNCCRKQFRFELIFIIAFLICFILIGVFDIKMYPPCPVYVVVIDYFPYAYPYLIASLITMQFVSLVKMLQLRFHTVNKCLKHVLVNSEASEIFRTISSKDESPKSTKQKIFSITKIFPEAPIKKERAFSGISENSLQQLFDVHDKLLDLSEFSNRSFSTNSIIYVAVSFVYVMFGVFFETKELFYNFPNDLNLQKMATSYLLWAAQYITIISILLRMCEETRRTAYETANIVRRIIQNKPKFMQNNDYCYNQMKSFIIQMLHRKKTFNFSGEGLFIFDYTFIFSIVSAGTSYLIVLLQFDMSFDRDEN